jgi:hypothetical protein
MEMMEMQVLHLAGISPAAQGLDEDVRNAGHAAQMDVAVGLDVADGLVGGYESDFFHFSTSGISYCGSAKILSFL